MSKIKVVELFAGVGGFRIGLEGLPAKKAGKPNSKKASNYEVVWSNQWEPSTKTQHASMVYGSRWGADHHSNEDIAKVEIKDIPNHDLLVGGFPCQDYSVATTLKNSKGLIGKKGVLWWQIHRILSTKKRPPKYLFLENVDRLLKSPSTQRGRDFAIMLSSLNDLGYAVEWRVINAAEYGMPQRRRRIFFLGYHRSTKLYKELKKSDKANWMEDQGIIGRTFEGKLDTKVEEFEIENDLIAISKNFNKGGKLSPFQNAGVMIGGKAFSGKVKPVYDGELIQLKDVLQNGEVSDEFFIDKKDLPRWEYLKGAKNEMRKSSQGFEYKYSEGAMTFPDALDRPSRTIITGEGGRSPSRFKHVVKTKRGLRRLTPVELERLNMFPDDHTKMDGVTDAKRAFFMGNALVVGVIEKIGAALAKEIL